MYRQLDEIREALNLLEKRVGLECDISSVLDRIYERAEELANLANRYFIQRGHLMNGIQFILKREHEDISLSEVCQVLRNAIAESEDV